MTNLEWIKALNTNDFTKFVDELTTIVSEKEEYVPFCKNLCQEAELTLDGRQISCRYCISNWLNAPHTKADEWEEDNGRR